MTIPQFRRRCRVTVSHADSAILTVDESLWIRFGIARSTGSETDRSFVDIMNLGQEARSLVSRAADHVRVEAGYGNALGLVGEGDIRRVDHSREGLDWITSLALGGIDTARRALFIRAYESVSLVTVVEDAAEAMGLSVDNGSRHLIPSDTLTEWSHDGYARDALDDLLASRDVSWFEVDGQLRFRRAGQPSRSGVRIIDESTGMVGIPAIEVDETTQNPGGVTGFILDATEPITDALGNILGGGAPVRGDVRVSVQLNPGIQLDEEIEVRSRVLVGRYDVVSLQHVGSTRDGEWVTMILGQGLDTEPAPV